MSAIIKFVKETYKTQTLLEAVKAGGWKALIDGNLAETTLIHSPGAKLMGEDRVGNRYYERMTNQYGRHRWVVYGDLRWPEGQDPSTVDSRWHSWLHYMNDDPPSEKFVPEPIFSIAPVKNMTGTDQCLLPKGAWQNPDKRNWKKFQRWSPPGGTAA
ncbi:hypothetical protein WJX73_009790 [Symbiochloris irregularis]|uniref:NADH dehydrogenase [ubiquinone] 1 alpha subcomplex subunit 12 n=1 Tax=Symbiochloris irregularis TaxID=706552 RepID=A0AAW1NMU7_9CHLO